MEALLKQPLQEDASLSEVTLFASLFPHWVLETMAATFLFAQLALGWTWRALARETAKQDV